MCQISSRVAGVGGVDVEVSLIHHPQTGVTGKGRAVSGSSSVSIFACYDSLRHAFHCGQIHPMEWRRFQQESSDKGGTMAMIGIAGGDLVPL